MRHDPSKRKKTAVLAALVASAVRLAQACNFTPGVPIPPPSRESFSVSEATQDCRGVMVIMLQAEPNTFEAGELALVTNTVTRNGVVAPAENDGSLLVEVPAADGEAISIRRRTGDGDESMPIDCAIPSPPGHECMPAFP
jgi:hypothetical protein